MLIFGGVTDLTDHFDGIYQGKMNIFHGNMLVSV